MKKLLAFLAVLIPVFTIAHPGHGVAENNELTHLMLSHGLLVVLALAAIAIGLFLVRKENKQ
jgi:hypothetical protein